MAEQTTTTAERIAAAQPELAPGADVPPPLPLVERVCLAYEGERGDHGGDPLLLGARLDAFLGRPASPEEIRVYAIAAGNICGARDLLDRFYGGVEMLVTDGDSHEFVTIGSAAAETYREELLASGNGYVDLGGARAWMPLGSGCIELATEGSARATVTFDPKDDSLAISGRVVDGEDVAYRLRTEEHAVEAMQTAARLGFFAGLEWSKRSRPTSQIAGVPLSVYEIDLLESSPPERVFFRVEGAHDTDTTTLRLMRGKDEVERLRNDSATDLLACAFDLGCLYERRFGKPQEKPPSDKDLVAIRSLAPGETWTRLLFRADEEDGSFEGSVRVAVYREFDGTLIVFPEEFTIEHSPKHFGLAWKDCSGVGEWPGYVTLDSPERVLACLDFYRILARDWHNSESANLEHRDLAAILALKPWGTYTRLILDVHEIEPDLPDYFHSIRLCAERYVGDEWSVWIETLRPDGWQRWDSSKAFDADSPVEIPDAIAKALACVPEIRRDVEECVADYLKNQGSA